MTKDTQDLLSFVQKLLVKDSAGPVTAETALFAEGHLNSMNILDLIGYVEEKIGRTLSDDELVMKNFSSVSSIEKNFLVN